jgi:DNA-binding response OmpR family regulator
VAVVEPADSRRSLLVDEIARSDDCEVSGSYSDFGQAIVEASSLKPPDVLLINADAIEAQHPRAWALLRWLVRHDLRIVALTRGEDLRCLELLLAMGVSGLHRPDAPPDRLLAAVQGAWKGVVDFDPALTAQVRIVLMGPPRENELRVGGLVLDLNANSGTRWGRALRLTPLEFRVLVYLARHKDRAIGIGELLADVWQAPHSRGGTGDQVRGCIKRLRRKIESDPTHPRYLVSSRGRGYQLRDPFGPDAAN